MKKLTLILCALLFGALAQAKQLDIGAPTTVSTSGSISASNAKQITMIFSATFAGTINGGSATALAGGTMTFYANQPGDNFAAITYTVSAGNIVYFKVF